MASPTRVAGAFALALVMTFPAFGQVAATDRRALDEKVRALEKKQVETTKALEALGALAASLEAAAPAAAHAELKQRLELLEKQQAETKADLQALRKNVAAASAPRTGPVEAPGLTPLDLGPSGSTGQVSSGTSFNPAISVIPESLYYNDSQSGGALGLTARHADAWQTAWFGLPDARFAGRQDRLLAVCGAEGRDPGTLDVTVGVEVRGPNEAPGGLPLDPSAIADGLVAWAAQGVDHVQVAMARTTPETVDVVLDGIARSRL